MKQMLLGVFYTLQGFGHFVYALILRVDVSFGGSGGVAYGLEIMFKGFFLFTSCLSLFTALTLFLRRKALAKLFGSISSLLLILFYVWMALAVFSGIIQGYYPCVAILPLLFAMTIVALNAMSMFFLGRSANK